MSSLEDSSVRTRSSQSESVGKSQKGSVGMRMKRLRIKRNEKWVNSSKSKLKNSWNRWVTVHLRAWESNGMKSEWGNSCSTSCHLTNFCKKFQKCFNWTYWKIVVYEVIYFSQNQYILTKSVRIKTISKRNFLCWDAPTNRKKWKVRFREKPRSYSVSGRITESVFKSL